MRRGTACLPRRSFILGAGLALVVARASASEFVYRDWGFDTSPVHDRLSDALVRSLQAQIDLVESLTIKPEIKSFFRHVDVRIDQSADALGATVFYRFRSSPRLKTANIHRLHLGTRPVAPDDPVLLEGLLLAYLEQRVRDGWENAEMAGFLDHARGSNAFPNRSWMMTSPQGFFAMCASVVLWGRAARPPFERAAVREKLPDAYAWIMREFHPAGAS